MNENERNARTGMNLLHLMGQVSGISRFVEAITENMKKNNTMEISIDWRYTAMDIIRSSNKIVECFSGQDTRNIFCRSDNEHDKIHAEIKTIADCL